jgi:hypothetical protein
MFSVTVPIVSFALSRAAQGMFTKRLVRFSGGFGRAFDGDPEQVADFEKSLEGDSDAQETIYRSVRMMMDAADPSVIDSLGFLAGDYTKNKRKPDAFFRGLGRLLCDLEAEEFDDLKRLLAALQKCERGPDAQQYDVVIYDRTDAASYTETYRKGGASGGYYESERLVALTDGDDIAEELGKFASAARLFLLLRREGLADDPPTHHDGDPVREGLPTGDLAVELPVHTVGDVLRIVEGHSPTPVK